jgi:hypothetical protein
MLAPLFLSPLLACVGRKALIQFGSLFNIFTTVIIGTGFIIINQDDGGSGKNIAAGSVMIMVGLISFMVNFAFTLGPLVWLYVP